jgi:hypothetical protein
MNDIAKTVKLPAWSEGIVPVAADFAVPVVSAPDFVTVGAVSPAAVPVTSPVPVRVAAPPVAVPSIFLVCESGHVLVEESLPVVAK